MKIFLESLSVQGHFSMIAGNNLDISSSQKTSLVTTLFFQTSVPFSLLLDLHLASSQSPIDGHIPSFPSHQEFAEGLNLGHAMAHRNITFVMCDLCLMHHFGFSPPGEGDISPSPGEKEPLLIQMDLIIHVMILHFVQRIPEVQCH